MSTENWMVKTREGQEWGLIRRLIIDPETTEIRHADVVLVDTGHMIRVPWDNFVIDNDEIRLGSPHRDELLTIGSSEMAMAHAVSMDLWP